MVTRNILSLLLCLTTLTATAAKEKKPPVRVTDLRTEHLPL